MVIEAIIGAVSTFNCYETGTISKGNDTICHRNRLKTTGFLRERIVTTTHGNSCCGVGLMRLDLLGYNRFISSKLLCEAPGIDFLTLRIAYCHEKCAF